MTIFEWLDSVDLSGLAQLFADNEIDFGLLEELDDGDLPDLALSLGHRKRLLKAI